MKIKVPFEIIYSHRGQVHGVLPILYGKVVPVSPLSNSGCSYVQVVNDCTVVGFKAHEVVWAELETDELVAKVILNDVEAA